MNPSSPNKPVKRFRSGPITASIWENQSEVDGRTVTQHSVRFQKRYRDTKGTWKTSETFFRSDLPDLELVTRKAFEFIALTEETLDDEAGTAAA